MGKSTIIWNLNSMHQNLCNIGKSPWLSTSHRLHVSVCACVGPCAGLRSPGQLSDTSDVVHTCPHVNMDTHIFFILLQIFIALSIVAGEWPNTTFWKFCKALYKAILCNKFYGESRNMNSGLLPKWHFVLQHFLQTNVDWGVDFQELIRQYLHVRSNNYTLLP